MPRHFIFICVFGGVYVLFNLIYVKATGSVIYSVLDWSSFLSWVMPFLLLG